MAEAILRSRNIGEVSVRSAGINAMNGVPIANNAKTLIEEAGMPYTPVSKAVLKDDVIWADLILTMTDSHKQMVLHAFPEATNKVFTLKGYVTPDLSSDVHDPYGGDLYTYKQTFTELSMLMDALERKLGGGQG